MSTLPPSGILREEGSAVHGRVAASHASDWRGWINYHSLPSHLRAQESPGGIAPTFSREAQEAGLAKVVASATYSVKYRTPPQQTSVYSKVTSTPAKTVSVSTYVRSLTLPTPVKASFPCEIRDFITHFVGGSDKVLWVRDGENGPVLCFGDFKSHEETPCVTSVEAFEFVEKAIIHGVPISNAFRAYLDHMCLWSFRMTYRYDGHSFVRIVPLWPIKSLQPGSRALQGYFDCLIEGCGHGEALRRSGVNLYDLFFDSISNWYSGKRPSLLPMLLPYDGAISSIFLNKPPTESCAYHCDPSTLSRASICALSVDHPFKVTSDSTSRAHTHIHVAELPEPPTMVGGEGGYGVYDGQPRPVRRHQREFVMCDKKCAHNGGVDLVPVRDVRYDGPWVVVINGKPSYVCNLEFDHREVLPPAVWRTPGRILTLQELIRVKILISDLHHAPFREGSFTISAPWGGSRSVWVVMKNKLYRIDAEMVRRVGGPRMYTYVSPESELDLARLPRLGKGYAWANDREWHARACDHYHLYCGYLAHPDAPALDFSAWGTALYNG